jgi:ATP-dependent exoDNAse (exonuclease V) beta subunit
LLEEEERVKHVTLIGAGAGSGKTFRLAEEVFHAVDSNRARADRIMLTTFTKKAASELRGRVTARLIAKGRHAAARQISGALIGTVHSICAQILQELAFDLGLATTLKVVDEDAAKGLFNRAIGEGVPKAQQFDLHRIGMLLELEDWRDTVRALGDIARVNAIPLDSLDRWAKASVESLLEGFDEDPNGRETLRAEVDQLMIALMRLVDEGTDTTKKTRDAIGVLQKALRELGKTRGITWSAIQRLTRLDPSKKAGDLADRVRKLADRNYTWPEMRSEMRFVVGTIFSAVRGTLGVYEQLKRELGAIDYVDMERMLLEALDKEEVRARLQERFDLLMVDEFQDTSPIQMAIFLKLMALAKEVVWVGDPKQAIYGFRGTDPQLMQAALLKIEAAGKTGRLEQSWRSRPELVSFVNDVFGDVFVPQGQRAKDVALQPTRKAELKTVPLESWVLTKVAMPEGRPRQNEGIDPAQIASEVKRVLTMKQHQVVDRSTGKVRAIEPGDIAVLVRANATSVALAAAFRAHGIPCEVATPGLLNELEVVWVRAAMDLLLNPDDALKAGRLTFLHDVVLRRKKTSEAWLTERIAAVSADKRCLPWSEHELLMWIREHSAAARSMSPEGLVALAIDVSGVLELGKAAKIPRLALANTEKMIHLARKYTQGEASFGRPATSTGFLAWLDHLGEQEQDRVQPIAANAVQICTYHAAKGLEWPMVILYQLNKEYEAQPFDARVTTPEKIDLERPLDGRGVIYWPYMYGRLGKASGGDFGFMDMVKEKSAYGIMARRRQEEEVRLLYVAMTRARDYLVFAARPDALQALGVLRDSKGAESLVVPQDEDAGDQGWLVRVPQIDPEPLTSASEADREWITYQDVTAKDPGRRTPSQQGGGAVSRVREAERYGGRVPIKDTDMTQLGLAMHAYLVVAHQERDPAAKQLLAEGILKSYGCEGAMAADDLVAAGEVFVKWVQKRWPGARAACEVPLYAFVDGVVTEGSADLVLETEQGLVIIDHKAFPGTEEKARERAAGYGAQLMTYKEVLERAYGKPVVEVGIHMAIGGVYFSVELPAAEVTKGVG